MKLADLNFNTPDNACTSLRMLAELARRGEVVVRSPTVTMSAEAAIACLEIIQPVKPVLDLSARRAETAPQPVAGSLECRSSSRRSRSRP